MTQNAHSLWSRRGLLARSVAFSALMGLGACQKPKATPSVEETMPPKDDHSYANASEARVRHVDLDLVADFERKVLHGTAALTLETAATAKTVILDTRDLKVNAVTDAAGLALKYSFGAVDAMMGQALIIELPQGAQKVVVAYETTDKATALQWLSPEQTAGKSKPFLFSQGQEIHTRTWIPTQDSPGIRQTFKATIKVPKGLTALMAADHLTPKGEDVADQPDLKAFRFKMDQPIAPYLIAIAVGDLSFKSLGGRTGVFAEPVTLDLAASEFVDLEKMVHAAEKLYGPYRWGRYDVLIMPPSFPFGGMENPKLTFATPTILAGDRSLVSLIAHELAHSWSGNLVTNATWADFWLNEGFTVYFENRIMEQVYGKETADMLKVLGHKDLLDTVADITKNGNPDFTKLHPDLKGVNPEDYFSEIPYEKGAAFLKVLEAKFGRHKFDGFLKSYFARHAFTSITTEQFLADLRTNLFKGDKALEESLKVDQWVYQRGLPDNVVVPKSDVFTKVEAEVAAFLKGADPKTLPAQNYGTRHWLHFLRNLPQTMELAQLTTLDEAFKFTTTHNSEILFEWCQIAIRNHYEPALPALESFLTSQGRRKFIAPLYRSLMEQKGWGEEMARRVYKTARSGYHDITRNAVDKLIPQK